MELKRYLSCLIVLLCTILVPVVAQERSYMEQLSVDEGLPHTDVSSVVQDGDGYVWIGTYSGLCRYDGNELTVYDISNSILASSRIRSLYLAPDGLLYIGTETGGVTIFDTERDVFVKTINVPSNYVNGIFPSYDGHSVIICTDDGISELSCHDGIYDLSSRSLGSAVSVCKPMDSENLLLGTPSSLVIFNMKTGKATALKDIFPTSFLAVKVGLLVTSYEGCWLVDVGTHTLRRLNACASKSSCIDRNGNVYIGTVKDGLLCYDSSLREVGNFTAGLHKTHEVSCVYCDRSDVLWVGTVGGGCYRSNANSRRFKLFSLNPEGEEEQVVAMMADDSDRLWLSSREGRMAVLSGDKVIPMDSRSLSIFDGRTVSALWQSRSGAVWVGSWDRGVAVIPASDVENAVAGRPFRIEPPRNLPALMSVYKFAPDSFGTVWIATGEGLYRSERGGIDAPVRTGWDCFRRDPMDEASLADDCVTDILVEESENGETVWVGTRSGLNRIDVGGDGNVRQVRRIRINPDGGAGEFISFIHRASDGEL